MTNATERILCKLCAAIIGFVQGPATARQTIRVTQCPVCGTPTHQSDMSLDAQRYRYLRSRDLKTISKGGVFAGMTPENIVLNGQGLDQEIDAAIASMLAFATNKIKPPR